MPISVPNYRRNTDRFQFGILIDITSEYRSPSLRNADRHPSESASTSKKRCETIDKGTQLWRAQLHNEWGPEIVLDNDGHEIDSSIVAYPSKPERMVPRPDRAKEGRVNPKGIPCLYLSDDRNTAMSEMRPWKGSYVSVAQFTIVKNLKVVNCSVDSAQWFFTGIQPAPAKREECVWGSMNRAFSEPVTRDDDIAEYAATQVLAEAFHNAGYDGIIYKSGVGHGRSVAVFNPRDAEITNRYVHRVEEVEPKYSQPIKSILCTLPIA